MDNLERYIKENRERMDIHDPDPALWGKIEEGLGRRRIITPAFLWRAAVILLIAGAGLTMLMGPLSKTGGRNNAAMNIIRETEHYYNSMIKSLYAEAEPMLTANPEVRTELTTGMNELDSICLNIMEDLKDNVATEEVVEALICNYRLRIDLLEDMLRIMKEEEPENEKTEGYEL